MLTDHERTPLPPIASTDRFAVQILTCRESVDGLVSGLFVDGWLITHVCPIGEEVLIVAGKLL